MVNRNLIIVIIIIILVAIGFIFVTNMTGNVITGAAVGVAPVVENEYFRIDGVEELDNTNELEVYDDKS